MGQLPDRRVLIRWMFYALGYLLLFFPNFVVHSVLRAEFWAGLLFEEHSARYEFFIADVYLYFLMASLLCLATAAGMKRNKKWSLPVGICTCALLLLGFPWLTMAGAVGLYVLLDKSS